MNDHIMFHGGCWGCTQQQKNGIEFCFDCQYFSPDWSLPNLNNRPFQEDEIEKIRVLKNKIFFGSARAARTVKDLHDQEPERGWLNILREEEE